MASFGNNRSPPSSPSKPKGVARINSPRSERCKNDGYCTNREMHHWNKFIHEQQGTPVCQNDGHCTCADLTHWEGVVTHSVQTRPLCKHDGGCWAKDPMHWITFWHPQQDRPKERPDGPQMTPIAPAASAVGTILSYLS